MQSETEIAKEKHDATDAAAMADARREKLIEILMERQTPPRGRPPVNGLRLMMDLNQLNPTLKFSSEAEFLCALKEMLAADDIRIRKGDLDHAAEGVWIVSSMCIEM